MLYEKEFRRLKEIYQALPEAQREIVGVMATLPPLAVVIYGAVLAPLGLIGIGGIITLAGFATAGTAVMMARATGLATAESVAALATRMGRAIDSVLTVAPSSAQEMQPTGSSPAIAAAPVSTATITMQRPFNTAALRTVTAANDAKPKPPKTAAKGIGAGK
ncbi:MAG TPA: hypothetical protein VEF76_05010 [Patescibacteria group bacterium]|nr:hypothetical protein [Patescibacteria group bacterium]